MSAISSLLKTGLKELPDNTVVPAQSVPNLLKKKGIKDEEIQFSGVELPKEGKVTKADLVKMEEGRKDVFSTEYANSYNWVSLKPGRNNPTYKEKVTTYSDKGAQPPVPSTEFVEDVPGEIAALEGSRYTSSHFSEIPNYLMHTRIYDDTIDGVPTRVVQEIQSDLHQAGRVYGYRDHQVKLSKAEQESLNHFLDSPTPEGTQQARDLLLREGFTEGDLSGELAVEEMARNALFDTSEEGMAHQAVTSPFEKTWLRKGMEREITDAIQEGRGQVAIPISGAVDDLQRASGVQKWYETTVTSTAKKVAKSAGMDFELKTVGKGVSQKDIDTATSAYHLAKAGDNELADTALWQLPDGIRDEVASMLRAGVPLRNLRHNLEHNMGDEVTYAVLKPKADLTQGERITLKMDPGSEEAQAIRAKMTPSFALYASPAATAFVAYQALTGGMAQDDVELMLTEEGFDTLEIQEILQNTQAIAEMKAAGYSDADIKPLLEQEEIALGESKTEPTGELEPPEPGRISDAYRDIMGADEMTMQELVAKMETTYPDDSYVTTNIAGFFGDKEAQRVSDESRLAQRKRIITEANDKLGIELEFGADGEWYANTEEGQVQVTPEWWRAFTENKMEMVGGFAGAYAGFKAGAAVALRTPGHPLMKLGAGFFTAVGVTAAGASLGTELDYMHSAMMIQQDFEARAMARKAMTAAELSVIGDAVVGGVFKLGRGSWQGLKATTELVRKGMFERAGTALKETFFITDEEAADAVARLSRVANVEGKTAVEKAIAASSVTLPGAEELVKASVHADPRASRAVVKAIDNRAKDLLANTVQLEGDDVGRFLREDLEGYRTLVREGFERVKVQAASAPKANAFRFNYDKMALDPVLERLGKNIENKDLAYKFAKQSQRIRDMSKSRRLSDLIELRKLVNEFRYNKRISNAKDFKMLDDIKAGIDQSIEIGANATMEDPKAWLSSWRTANKQYSEMKALEKNVLATAISRPGVSERAIGQELTKYAGALDDTFIEVVAKLPKQARSRAEGAVMNTLAEKFTQGAVDGIKATDFPALAKELSSVNFTSPEARSLKKAINTLAEVFKNDVPLSESAGGIQVRRVQQAMTTNMKSKAEFALASELFHHARSLLPDSKGRASALVVKAAKLLENPMNSKTIKELQEMLDGEINIDINIEQVIKAAAQQKADGTGMPRVRLYGDGKVLVGKGAGKEQSIPIHRIAPTEKVKEISEATGINMSDKKALDAELRDRGYSAAQLGADKVRLLGE